MTLKKIDLYRKIKVQKLSQFLSEIAISKIVKNLPTKDVGGKINSELEKVDVRESTVKLMHFAWKAKKLPYRVNHVKSLTYLTWREPN